MQFEPMTEEEIKRDVRLSANPEKQVKILADINAVTPKIIRRILEGQTWEQAQARRRPNNRYVCKNAKWVWAYEENEALKRLYRSHTPRKEISIQLSRSVGAINSKIRNLRKKGEII